jgi:long-chain acyl-CoA synthetase
MSTLQQIVAQALGRHPSQRAFEFERRWYDWGELQAMARQVNRLLEEIDTDKGAPAAFIARNRPSAIAALLALIEQERHIIMVFAFQSSASIAIQLDELKPGVALFMAEDDTEDMRAILRERGLAAIVLAETSARIVPGCERGTASWQRRRLAPEIQILTSGTTGPPKQFAISYELIANHMVKGEALTSIQGDAAGQQPPPLLFYPIGNITGLSSTIQSLLRGTPFILLDRFNLARCLDYMREYRPKMLHLPPAAIQMVLDADIPPADFAPVAWIATGAAPLDPDVQRAFEKHYGLPILSSYGGTEFAGPAISMTMELYREWGDKKFGSIGRPLPGIQLRVIDQESGAALPPGNPGILEAIVPRVGPDWIRTADIVLIDEDGFVFHRGRADGAIMRGGFKVLPETIERALHLHEAISAAAVVGIPDKRLGQVPAAAIQIKPGVEQPAVAELEQHLRKHVLATHIPIAWRIVDELPKNPSFKIDRGALRRMFEA